METTGMIFHEYFYGALKLKISYPWIKSKSEKFWQKKNFHFSIFSVVIFTQFANDNFLSERYWKIGNSYLDNVSSKMTVSAKWVYIYK